MISTSSLTSSRSITAFLAIALLALNAPARAADFPDMVVPNTAGVQLKGAPQPQEMDLIKDMGIKFVRHGFHWEGIEKVKGQYDFTSEDALMKDLREHGLRVLGCIAFGNNLYGKVYDTDDGRAGYANFAAALAEHYKDDKVIWEIWNEPNTMTFWGKHGGEKGNSDPFATEYVNLVKATVPAMRKADPHCTIVAGSTSNLWSESYKWMDFCFAKGVLQSGIDGWSVHPYSVIRPEDYLRDYDLVRDIMVKYGAPRDFPILNTERGYPVSKAEGYAGGDPKMNQQYQAWHLVRQYLMDFYAGLKLTSYYEWSSKYDDGKPFGIYNGNDLNLAGQSYKVMIDQLSGYRLDKRIATKSPLDFVLSFTGPGGAIKYVAWTTPPPAISPLIPPSSKNPHISGPDMAVPHDIDIPVAATGSLDLVQIDGTKSSVAVNNGSINVALTGGPQYITVHANPVPAVTKPATPAPSTNAPAATESTTNAPATNMPAME